MQMYWRSGGIIPLILNLGVRWGEGSTSRPFCFTARETDLGTCWIGGWSQRLSGHSGGEEKKSHPSFSGKTNVVMAEIDRLSDNKLYLS